MLATQNPIESEGTYPLPEAQVDRFMFKVVIDYPSANEEAAVVTRSLGPPADVEKVLSPEKLIEAQKASAEIVDRALIEDWVVDLLASATRTAEGGRSPDARALHRIRREPPRPDQPDPRRARARPRARARLRAPADVEALGFAMPSSIAATAPTRRSPKGLPGLTCSMRYSTAIAPPQSRSPAGPLQAVA